jgi:hypothetical protein
MDAILKMIHGLDEAAMKDCAKHVMLGGGTRGGPVLPAEKAYALGT